MTTTVGRALVFTDIENSTLLLREYPGLYPEMLQAHHEVIRSAFAEFGGFVANTMGDGCFVISPSAHEALRSALLAQRRVTEVGQRFEMPVRVRMGIHWGDINIVQNQYLGVAVHQAARIGAAANGGQILLSDAARANLPDVHSQALTPLGMFRVRDFDQPQLLYAAAADDDCARQPPRATAVRPRNLPHLATSFVGRVRERHELARLLSERRLVTVLGPGGIGKTRLCFEVVADLAQRFSDGAAVLLLANVTAESFDERLLLALHIREDAHRAAADVVAETLRDRTMLLLFDNCEHIIDAVRRTAELLHGECPGVTILATSREALGLQGEMEWRLDPLSVTTDGGGDADAVTLFIQRLREREPSIEVTGDEVETIRSVCRRLDGIPLAVELAAGRMRHMTLDSLAASLKELLPVLALGDRAKEARQQSVRNLIDWSYDLLSDDARAFMRCFSVFETGVDFHDVAAVAGRVSPNASDLLSELVDKSLINFDRTGTNPYRMLALIRAYAREKMTADDEEVRVRTAHLDWCHQRTQELGASLDGFDAGASTEVITSLYENFAAAVDWGLNGHEPLRAAEVVANLGSYWQAAGRISEGIKWLSRIQQLPLPAVIRCGTTASAGQLASFLGETTEARRLCAQALELSTCEAPGMDAARAHAHNCLGHVLAIDGDHEAAIAEFHAASRTTSAKEQARAQNGLGAVAYYMHHYSDALAFYQTAYEMFESIGNYRNRTVTEVNIGEVLLALDRYEEALQLLLPAAAASRGIQRGQFPDCCELVARACRAQGNEIAAVRWLEEGSDVAREIGDLRKAEHLERLIATSPGLRGR